jgi:hypothetical protein
VESAGAGPEAAPTATRPGIAGAAAGSPSPAAPASPADGRERQATGARLAKAEARASADAATEEGAASVVARPEAARVAPARQSAAAAGRPPAVPPIEVRQLPGCTGEARRVLWRDPAGRLQRRERSGVLGGVGYRAVETFDAEGGLIQARVEAGGKVATADLAGLARGQLAGLVPGLALAATAARAEADPPGCGP